MKLQLYIHFYIFKHALNVDVSRPYYFLCFSVSHVFKSHDVLQFAILLAIVKSSVLPRRQCVYYEQ